MTRIAIIFLVSVLGSTDARAWEVLKVDGDICEWNNLDKDARFSPVSFLSGRWRDAGFNAITRFNRNPSKFEYHRKVDTGGVAFMNDQIEVWFSDDEDWFPSTGTLGVAFPSCGGIWFFGWQSVNMEQADVLLNVNVDWTTSEDRFTHDDYDGEATSLRAVLLHELGHAAGLRHENDEYNVVGDATTYLHANGDRVRAYFGEDAGSRVPAAVVAKKWAVAWGLDETERPMIAYLESPRPIFPPLRDHSCAFFVEEFRSVSKLP